MFNRTDDELARTNNSIEGWHRSIDSCFHNTTFYRLSTTTKRHLFIFSLFNGIYLFSLYYIVNKKIHAYNNIKTYNEVLLAYQRYAN